MRSSTSFSFLPRARQTGAPQLASQYPSLCLVRRTLNVRFSAPACTRLRYDRQPQDVQRIAALRITEAHARESHALVDGAHQGRDDLAGLGAAFGAAAHTE